jgi:hypothetical protein
MMKRIVLAILMCSMVVMMAPRALAANVHLKAKPPLTFTDQGLTLNATGALTGLGNGDIVVALTATGQPTATCTNPAGATKPPGQNPASVTLTGAQAIPGSSIKNGNVGFNVSTGGPPSPVPGAPDCPNSSWTEDITDVAFSSATLTVYQPCTDTSPPIDCTVVFTRAFSL